MLGSNVWAVTSFYDTGQRHGHESLESVGESMTPRTEALEILNLVVSIRSHPGCSPMVDMQSVNAPRQSAHLTAMLRPGEHNVPNGFGGLHQLLHALAGHPEERGDF